MITIGYPPKHVGGTEIYVFGLVEALKQKGHECFIAYVEPIEQQNGPEMRITADEYMGTAVYEIQVNSVSQKLEFLIFDSELRAKLIKQFRELVSKLRPDIVHVHPLQLGLESYLIEMMNQEGEKVLFTYHSSTTSCARGDLIRMGTQVCDGLILQSRCTKCFYHWKSVPTAIAAPLAKLPLPFYQVAFAALSSNRLWRKPRSFVSVPLIIRERRKAWRRATTNARMVVAVCQWVRDTILKNGVPEEKIVLSRHGLRLAGVTGESRTEDIVKFGYLGRISPEKGIQVLLAVLENMPAHLEYEFEICSSSFYQGSRGPAEEDLIQRIYRLQNNDDRVRVLEFVSDSRLRETLSSWDAIVVPSLWLESGPQVVYEAFAVQTPVIGSRLGGIAELVKEGETGVLFEAGNAKELSDLLRVFVYEPERLRRLRVNIPPVRTTSDVADDMINLYGRLLAHTSAA